MWAQWSPFIADVIFRAYADLGMAAKISRSTGHEEHEEDEGMKGECKFSLLLITHGSWILFTVVKKLCGHLTKDNLEKLTAYINTDEVANNSSPEQLAVQIMEYFLKITTVAESRKISIMVEECWKHLKVQQQAMKCCQL